MYGNLQDSYLPEDKTHKDAPTITQPYFYQNSLPWVHFQPKHWRAEYLAGTKQSILALGLPLATRVGM